MTANETSGGEGSERLRVVVVDDHALFRRGLEMVLSQEDDIELVGEASDGGLTGPLPPPPQAAAIAAVMRAADKMLNDRFIDSSLTTGYQPTRRPVVHATPEYSPPVLARSFMSAN